MMEEVAVLLVVSVRFLCETERMSLDVLTMDFSDVLKIFLWRILVVWTILPI